MRMACNGKRRIFRVLVTGFIFAGLLSTAYGAERVTGEFETTNVKINYLIMLPDEYGADASKQWPLFFGLHGADVRGDNVELLFAYETPPGDGYIFPDTLEIREKFIRAWPQCPADMNWTTPEILEALGPFLDDVIAKYAVDVSRIYLFGISLGGQGVWAFGMGHPNRFTAISPIVGISYNVSEVCVLKDVPIWVFHSEKDEVVDFMESQVMVDALKACGGNVKFTLYPDADHVTAAVTAGNTLELYNWFLEQSLQDVLTNIRADDKLISLWGQIKEFNEK